jgi:hypothetical protein
MVAQWIVERFSAFADMITREQVIPMLIEVCPSFRATSADESLLYVSLGDFARHLLLLHRQGRTEEFPAVAKVIERLQVEGDSFVREAVAIGLLEGIQNVWSNAGTDPELFIRHLLPVSTKWWRSLNDFWAGKSKFVGENL